MPSQSKSQYKFFQYLKANPEVAKEKGISKKTIEDFLANMTKDKWQKLKEKVIKKK